MEPTLPPAIAAYFSSQATRQPFAQADCFAADAVVHDESTNHVGLAAISAWQLDTMRKTPFSARPTALTELDGNRVVTVEISGAFPGSPVTLDHVFTLRNSVISALKIG